MYNLTPQSLLDRITTSEFSKDYIYVITGKNGPTGKSWLCRELRLRGYHAVEINESLLRYGHVELYDNFNHYVINELDNSMLIILNERVEGYQ